MSKMHMQLGRCAHCGDRLLNPGFIDKHLDQYAVSHERHWTEDPKSPLNPNRPYFCVRCFESVVDEELQKEYLQERKEIEHEYDSHDILLASAGGKAVRFPVSAVRVFQSRASEGVRGMELADGDDVVVVELLLDDR